MDITIEHYLRSGTAQLFPPVPLVATKMEEYQRTRLIDHERPIEMIANTVSTYDNDNRPIKSTALAIRFTNEAVYAIQAASAMLRHHRNIAELEMPEWAKEQGLLPYYKKTRLDMSSVLDTPEKADQLYRALQDEINHLVMGVANTRTDKRLAVLIYGDPIVQTALSGKKLYAGDLLIDGIISIHHVTMRGVIYLTLALVDENGYIVPEASFGNLLYTPSQDQINSVDNLVQHVTTTNTYLISTLPVLGVLIF